MTRLVVNIGNRMVVPTTSRASFASFWTPTEITTAAWYDASDANTISESGGDVSQWSDKSGNDNHATQGTIAYKPTYSSTGWDGSLSSIDFTITGSDGNELESPTANGFTDTEYVYFIMTEPLSRVSQTRHLAFVLLGGGDQACYNKASGGIQGMGTYAAGYVGEVPERPIRKQMLTYDYSSGGEFYRDGDSVFSGAWTPSSFLPTYFQIGHSGGSRYDGKMSEIIIMNKSDCNNATRQKVEGYLAWKWGLESELPIGHPYKNSRPVS